MHRDRLSQALRAIVVARYLREPEVVVEREIASRQH
jgi:hypothetical protein